jgi:fibronectin type 3 domain-containing protein
MFKKRIYTVALNCILLLGLISCETEIMTPPEESVDSQGNKVVITIRLQSIPERTVLPQFPVSEITRYELYGNIAPSGEIPIKTFPTLIGASIALDKGTWNFTLKAYKGNISILEGKITNKAVNSSSDILEFTLNPITTNSGQGTVLITIVLPDDTPITHAAAIKERLNVEGENIITTKTITAEDSLIVYTEGAEDTGDYFISFQLKDRYGKTRAVISEIVYVLAGLKSEKTIVLDENNSNLISPPSGLTAERQSSSVIKLNWSAVTEVEVEHYTIYRASTAAGVYTKLISITGTSHEDTGLPAATTYYYKVSAVSSDHEEGAASFLPSSATTYTTTPAIGSIVAASTTSIIITWGPISEATRYILYRSTSPDGVYAEVANNITASSYTNSGLSSSTTYYYRVSAFSTNGLEGKQSDYRFTTTLPAAPAGLSAAGLNSSSISISWTPIAGAVGYRIYRSATSAGTYTQIGSSSEASYIDSGLLHPVTNYYQVSAYTSGGEGAVSASVSGSTMLNTGKAITAFNFITPEVTGTINEEEKTIGLIVPADTILTTLAPEITISPGATVSPESGIPSDFTEPQTYTVTAEDGSTAVYAVTVTVDAEDPPEYP